MHIVQLNNPKLSKRMILTTALCHERGKRHLDFVVTAFTPHGFMLIGYDKFNSHIHERMWPHKRGGFSTFGDRGKEDDFNLTSVLLNTWFTTKSINNHLEIEDDFLFFCNAFFEHLFALAL